MDVDKNEIKILMHPSLIKRDRTTEANEPVRLFNLAICDCFGAAITAVVSTAAVATVQQINFI